MVPLLTLVLAALFTMAVGVPLAARLARVHVWRRSELATQASTRTEYERMFPFEPLDLGPDTMKWPSEISRPTHAMPLAEWPSASWDDPHFGKGAPPEVVEARVVRKELKRSVKPVAAKPEPDPKARAPRQPKPAQTKPAPVTPTQAMPEAPRVLKRPPAKPSNSDNEALPNRRQVESMIAEHGLAGTVQALMKHQGWDFKEAATWLAQIRRGE